MAMKEVWMTFKHASWLGWQMESNWTEPWVFIAYSIVRPVMASLLLVVMYMVITGGTTGALFSYIYVGSAFFMYVANVLFGVAWVIHEDREHYQTLKYIYISPANFYAYILGRSTGKILLTTFSVIITLLFGIFALDIQMPLSAMNWPLLVLGMGLGLACITAFGVALAGISFLTARHAVSMNESVAGIFYLFCGAIFPISALPAWSWAFAKVLPVTYWLYVMRMALFGSGSEVAAVDAALSGYDAYASLVILALSTLVFILISVAIFKVGDHVARKKGLIDAMTNY
jgi:ABC-2 type transport system permease protein